MKDWTPEQRAVAAELARQDFYFYVRYMFLRRKGFKWGKAPHHKLICDALMRVYRGEVTRLIINIPPRYSKTEILMKFIAWTMGHHPDAENIHVSYAAGLAVTNSAGIREEVQHEAYLDIFPQMRLGKAADYHWTTSKGGVMYASGIGGTLTGYGAGKMREEWGGGIFIDDPHKADEAKSDVIRGGVLNFYDGTLKSRANDPARTPQVLIMQRLHEEDLAGYLLAGGSGEKWEHLNLSVWQDEADTQPLWPEKHSAEALRIMEKAAPYVFAGQYRQRPSPPKGGTFQPDSLVIVDAVPAGVIQWCAGWDFGASVDGDYTVRFLLGKITSGSYKGYYIIKDVKRIKAEPGARDLWIRKIVQNDGLDVKHNIPQDPGQAGKSHVRYATISVYDGYSVNSSPETGDKVTRAEGFAAQINIGNCLMLRSHPDPTGLDEDAHWNDWLTKEQRYFPFGKNDDAVDAGSRAFMALNASSTGMIDYMQEQVEMMLARNKEKVYG